MTKNIYSPDIFDVANKREHIHFRFNPYITAVTKYWFEDCIKMYYLISRVERLNILEVSKSTSNYIPL